MKVLLIGNPSENTEKLHTLLSARGHRVHRILALETQADVALESIPDVVLLTQDLISGSLVETLETLREKGTTAPAIVLSANQSLKDDLRTMGPFSILNPNSSFETLLQEVTAAGLRKGGRNPKDLGALSLDTIKQIATIHGDNLQLTETEFKLLQALADRPGKVVSTTRLLSNVWGLQHDPQSNRVAVYMKKLRQKLPDGMIENQRGVGYRLILIDSD